MPQVMVISAEGDFYVYNIDLDNGGECLLTKQFRQASILPLVSSQLIRSQYIGPR